VFNLAAVCALSGTDFAAFVAQTAVATLNHKSHQLRSTTLVWPALTFPFAAKADYFPPPGPDWEMRAPEAVGVDPIGLQTAVRLAWEHEVPWTRDVLAQIRKDVAAEPYPEILGETKERGGPAGMIVKNGYLIAQWGDIDRVDMSFSLAKSYLSALAGLALDEGKISGLDALLADNVRDGGFESRHNRKITWHMLLNQTSEWEGSLWDKPDVADRRRGYDRILQEPGTFWEYNDVRVNRLALALLRIFGRPLPAILKEKIMNPIGASDTWVWHGYRNSYLLLDGLRVQSVSGGSHWGGGLWASTRDHARFGYLWLRRGKWNGRRILSEAWVGQATSATQVAPHYGYLWWVSPRRIFPSAPEGSFFAMGSGGNMIWVDPARDLIVVTRWFDTTKINELISLLSTAVPPEKKQ
jgi:Beta-lactamase